MAGFAYREYSGGCHCTKYDLQDSEAFLPHGKTNDWYVHTGTTANGNAFVARRSGGLRKRNKRI